MRGISWLAANQLASQEELCTVEWVMTVNRRLGTPNKRDCFLLSKISNAWNLGVCEPVLRNADGVPVVKMQRAVTVCWGGACVIASTVLDEIIQQCQNNMNHALRNISHASVLPPVVMIKKHQTFSFLINITDGSFNTSLCKKIFHLRSKQIFHQFYTFPYHKLWQFFSVSILSVSQIQRWNAGCLLIYVNLPVYSHTSFMQRNNAISWHVGVVFPLRWGRCSPSIHPPLPGFCCSSITIVATSVMLIFVMLLLALFSSAKAIPLQDLRAPGGWGTQIARESVHEGGKVFSTGHINTPPLPGNIPGTPFCYSPPSSAAVMEE